jgi:hypothetical protein
MTTLSKTERLKQDAKNIIDTCDTFYRKHKRGPTNIEIKMATGTAQDRTFHMIDRLIKHGLLIKQYYEHKPSGVWHVGYVPTGLEEKVIAEESEARTQQEIAVRRNYWVNKASWWACICLWWYGVIRNAEKQSKVYLKETNKAFTKAQIDKLTQREGNNNGQISNARLAVQGNG